MSPPVRTALVTGASGGIGLELARLFAADGYELVLVARRADRLQALAEELRTQHGVNAQVCVRDLSEPGAARGLWAELTDLGVRVDVLVNNAGVGLHGRLASQSAEALRRMIELNVAALTALTHLALPGMLERRWGRILNVSSVAAHQPGGPGMAAYYASKAYVLSFSRGLAGELRGSGVSVTALCPGPTATAFEEQSGATGTRLYRWLRPSHPRVVAGVGYRGMLRGAGVVVPGALAKLLAFAGMLPPRRLALAANQLLLRGT